MLRHKSEKATVGVFINNDTVVDDDAVLEELGYVVRFFAILFFEALFPLMVLDIRFVCSRRSRASSRIWGLSPLRSGCVCSDDPICLSSYAHDCSCSLPTSIYRQ